MLKGNVFNIQRFCTDDGDGIRTVVFLKGCPLRCLWCHNPESQSANVQLSYDESACVNCRACESVCPNRCHSFDPDGKHQFDRSACIVCGKCADACPSGALECAGKEYTVDEVISLVLRDKDFYQESGGMTLSGGEPLMQGEFSVALAREAKKHGLNVCIETCGFVKRDILEQIIHYTDCFLFDYKCHPADYNAYTGVEFTAIEENLAYLCGQKKRVVLRCPIVPGCIREDHFDRIGQLTQKYGIQEIEFLPYHNLGVSKCYRFDMEIQPTFPSVNKDELQTQARSLMERCEVSVIVR